MNIPNLSIKHWLVLVALGLLVGLVVLAKFSRVKASTTKPEMIVGRHSSSVEEKKKYKELTESLDSELGKVKQEEGAKNNTTALPQNPMAQFQAQQLQQMMAQQAAQRAAMNYGAPRREESAAATESGKSFVISFRDEEPRSTTAAPVVQKAAKDEDGGFPCGLGEDYYLSSCIEEGKVILATITNELRGDYTGPVIAQVSQAFISNDNKHVLVPKGTIVIGESGRVGGQEQARLAIDFHRMILSGGSAWHRAGWAISLDKLQGLSVDGSAGQEGHVNHHWGSTIAASAAYGLLAGFALSGTGSYLTNDGVDVYRQGISQAAGQQGQQVISRMMNRMPTITVPVGSECNVYVATDLRMRQ